MFLFQVANDQLKQKHESVLSLYNKNRMFVLLHAVIYTFLCGKRGVGKLEETLSCYSTEI